jgi:hypothetical protein
MGRVLSVLVNIERGPDRVSPEVVNRTTWTDGASQCPHTAIGIPSREAARARPPAGVLLLSARRDAATGDADFPRRRRC